MLLILAMKQREFAWTWCMVAAGSVWSATLLEL
jgi:hypothetical protein